MARSFLIDGHNALWKLFERPPSGAEAARNAVLEKARGTLAVRAPGDRAHVVFDTSTAAGRMRASTFGREGALSWSYADGSADEEIVRLVRDGGARDGMSAITVVTDDRELRGRASQLGAKTLRIHEWFAGRDAAEERADRVSGKSTPPMSGADFGFTSDVIDLDTFDPDA